MKKSVVLALLLLVCVVSAAQDSLSVCLKGRVTDGKNEPVSFCIVRVSPGGAATTANIDGVFELKFHSADSVRVSFSMIGYRSKSKLLNRPKGNLTLNVVLLDDGQTMSEVEVKELRRNMNQDVQISTEQIKTMPSPTGNAVEELVATQAGVSQHNELSSQYTVRGGSFDENCVYINGVEVYRPLLLQSGEQEGLSVINPYMVDNVDFSAGGFSAKYADKMSSVLNIKYKKPTAWEGNLSASLLGANGYMGWGNRKISISHSLRYKTNKYMLGGLSSNSDYEPNFIDYQAYVSWRPHKNWTVDGIVYISQNDYKFTPHTRSTSFGTMEDVKNFDVYFDGWEQDLFQTYYGSLQVKGVLSEKHTIGLNYNAFRTRERVTYDIQGQYWLYDTSAAKDLSVGTYLDHSRSLLNSQQHNLKLTHEFRARNHFVESGLGYSHQIVDETAREWEYRDSSGYSMPHSADDFNLIYLRKTPGELRMTSDLIELYSQDTWRLQTKLVRMSLNYGVRLSWWSWNKEWLCSPRFSLGIVPKNHEQMTIRLATGLYNQRPFYKELRYDMSFSDANHPNSSNVNVIQLSRDVKSQRSWQIIAGYDYRFKIVNRPFLFTTEAYYKHQWDLNPYTINNTKIVYYGRNCARGYVTGVDFKLYGEFVPGTNSWLTFSLMRARMILNGMSVPQPTDQTWSLNMFFTDYFPRTTRWKLNLRACFSGGLPFGAPHTGLETHTFRSTPYRRVDLGMNYCPLKNEDHHRKICIKTIWLGVDCLNVFGFENVSGYYWVNDVSNNQYAVPNYLTGRMFNARVSIDF